MNYPYSLPPLPYAYDALEPYVDAETMRYHHDKHFQTYIDNLNAALAPYPALQNASLEWLLCNPNKLPSADRQKILNNAGGVYNHNLFFLKLTPDREKTKPQGRIAQSIDSCFGSFNQFKQAFDAKAKAVFGSGWTQLICTPRGGLEIVSVANQDTVVPCGATPIISADVWEHAYYLKYKNARADYLGALWNVYNWQDQ